MKRSTTATISAQFNIWKLEIKTCLCIVPGVRTDIFILF